MRRGINGFFNYHAVLAAGCERVPFRHHVTSLWRRRIRRCSRCSQKDRSTRTGIKNFAGDRLSKPRILGPTCALSSDPQGGGAVWGKVVHTVSVRGDR